MPTKKTAQAKPKAATKTEAAKPAAKKTAASAAKKVEAKAKPPAKEKPAAKPAKANKAAPKTPAKAAPKPAAPPKSAKPLKTAKAAAKPRQEAAPKATTKATEPKPSVKQKPVPAPKPAAEAAEAASPAAKSAKAAKANGAKPPKAAKLDPVEAAFAKPPPAKPMAVAAGRAQPLAKTLATPAPRAAPKPLAAPKPVQVEAEETAGESKPVPAFKATKTGNGPMVLIGAVAGAFGVKGEVRLRAFTEKPDGVISYGPLYGEDGKVVLKPKSWRALKDGVAVVTPEVKTREQAEQMRGLKVFVPRANLPRPSDDEEYYWVDLMGCQAEAVDGAQLGEVVAVWNFGAGDILELRPPNGGPNLRISFTKENVPLVDPVAKRIVVDPPAPEQLGK